MSLQTTVPEPDHLHTLSNPLATISQLSTSSSQLDGVPASLETSLRFAGAQLTQAAGILLRLPQEIIAQAIVIFYRFYLGSEGGSFRINAVKVRPSFRSLHNDISLYSGLIGASGRMSQQHLST